MLLSSLLGLLSFDSVIPKKEGWIAAVAATTVTPLQTDDGGEFRFGPGLTCMEWSMVLTDAGGSIYENATLPESYWKQSNDKYEDYPLHTPPSFAGISDGVIDEVTGIAQLAKLGLEVVTDKQVRDGMAEAVKGLSVEGLKAAAVNMIEERRSIYTGGSPADVTAYTIGKDVVEVASVFYGGFAAKGKQLGEAVEETGGRVRKGGNPFIKTANEIRDLLKTDKGTAFFGQAEQMGFGGQNRALEVARTKGGITLEGLLEEKGIKMPPFGDNPKIWEDVSAEYANQVSGEIRAVVGKELREGNVWENIELPRLKLNLGVSRIVIIDPETLIETVIINR